MLPVRSGIRAARRPALRLLATGLAALTFGLSGAVVAVATVPTDPEQTLTVEGTLINLVVEQADGQSSGAGELEVRSAIEVDGQLHELSADTPVAAGVTGDDVTVTIEADGGLAVDEALEIATGSADAVEGDAEIVEVAAVGESTSGATASVVAAGALGTHTLTVLPVYWGSTDGTSQASLANLASMTAQYWAEQSGGGISVQASARGWAPIADPGTCNTDVIFDRALAAHGVPEPTGTAHVLVYFPKRSDCGGWAGLASIGGGYIWVNGTPLADVFAHEFGHNLGLGHANRVSCTSGGTRVPLVAPMGSACAVSEYLDRADVMGIATTSASGSLNTALADHLGLVSVQRVASGGSATVVLAPLASTSAVRSVAIPVSGGTVYVDFRPATGRDVRMSSWAGVQVHYRTLNAQYGYPTSYLLDMTAPTTTSFTSPAFPAGSSWSLPGTTQVVRVESVGATARVSVAPGQVAVSPGSSALEAYITSVYIDLFERAVDPSGLNTWSTALRSGTPRVAVANSITYSAEYRSRLIANSYQTYLGRSPDSGGLAHWLRMMNQGMTIQQMEAGFLASPEYYQLAGSSDARWVQRLYQHVLGRSAGSSEVTHWVAMLTGGWTRDGVAMGFLISTEHLTTVVDGYYVDLLGRHIDPSGRTTWVGKIQAGDRVEAIIGGIIASAEYYGRR